MPVTDSDPAIVVGELDVDAQALLRVVKPDVAFEMLAITFFHLMSILQQCFMHSAEMGWHVHTYAGSRKVVAINEGGQVPGVGAHPVPDLDHNGLTDNLSATTTPSPYSTPADNVSFPNLSCRDPQIPAHELLEPLPQLCLCLAFNGTHFCTFAELPVRSSFISPALRKPREGVHRGCGSSGVRPTIWPCLTAYPVDACTDLAQLTIHFDLVLGQVMLSFINSPRDFFYCFVRVLLDLGPVRGAEVVCELVEAEPHRGRCLIAVAARHSFGTGSSCFSAARFVSLTFCISTRR